MTTLKERPTETQTRTAAREKEFTPLQTAPPKKKFPVLAIIAGVAALGMIVFAVLFFTQRNENEPRVSAKDEAQAQKVLSGQWTAKDSKELEKDVNRQIADFQKNQGQTVAPVSIAPAPETKTGLQFFYKETASAKGKIELKSFPSKSGPEVVSITITNLTDRPILIKDSWEGKDATGKVIEKDSSNEWYKMRPGYVIGPTNVGTSDAKTWTMWIEVQEVN